MACAQRIVTCIWFVLAFKLQHREQATAVATNTMQVSACCFITTDNDMSIQGSSSSVHPSLRIDPLLECRADKILSSFQDSDSSTLEYRQQHAFASRQPVLQQTQTQFISLSEHGVTVRLHPMLAVTTRPASRYRNGEGSTYSLLLMRRCLW